MSEMFNGDEMPEDPFAGEGAPLNGATLCIECSQPTTEGRCINSDCTIAQRQATLYAGRQTVKHNIAGDATAVGAAPRAVSRQGYVD